MTLHDWLEKQGKTQRWLAEALGATRGHVSHLISGTRRPGWDLMAKIMEISKDEVRPEDFMPKRPGQRRRRQTTHDV